MWSWSGRRWGSGVSSPSAHDAATTGFSEGSCLHLGVLDHMNHSGPTSWTCSFISLISII